MNARHLLLAVLLCAAAPAYAARDVVLVLDNSGSMRHNDPARLAPAAVEEFVKAQPRDTRVAIVLFANEATLAMPFTPAEVAADGDAQQALAKFNYRGALTRTAAAIERALYELRNEGRPDAQRAIVLMTDGLIDTGTPAKNEEMESWLRKDLAAQAAREKIGIFGIAFTENADYELLQSLAQTTNAEYFRVLNAAGIGKALQRIETTLNVAPAAAAVTPAPAPVAAAPSATPSAPIETPPPAAEPPPAAAPQSSSHLGWLWWLLAVLFAGAAAFALWRRRAAAGGAAKQAGTPGTRNRSDHGVMALLYDSMASYEIGDKPVVIGRAGGNDPSRYYVIVPDKTVGRWHATIERRGQTFWLRVEGSVNGTFVNGVRITGERPLKHRDQLKFHNHTFDFEIPELGDMDRTIMQPSPHPMN